MTNSERCAIDRIVSAHDLPTLLTAIEASYSLHLTHSNGRDDVERLQREKNLVSQFRGMVSQ